MCEWLKRLSIFLGITSSLVSSLTGCFATSAVHATTPPMAASHVPTLVMETPSESGSNSIVIKQMAVHDTHALFLDSENTVWYMSGLDFTPRELFQLDEIADLTISNHVSYARLDSGVILAWTYDPNSWPPTVDVDLSEYPIPTIPMEPVAVVDLPQIQQLSASHEHAVALDIDGNVWTWGNNDFGQSGRPGTGESASPARLNGIPEMVFVSAGPAGCLAIDSEGKLWGWGAGVTSAGPGIPFASDSPIVLNGERAFVEAYLGTSHILALDHDATVWAWGANVNGELGYLSDSGAPYLSEIPVRVRQLPPQIVSVVAASRNSAALDSDGHLWMWGRNNAGQVGNGTYNDADPFYGVFLPEQVPLPQPVIEVGMLASSTLALDQSGRVWIWGYTGEVNPTGAYTVVPIPLEFK